MIFHCLASGCTIHSVWNPLPVLSIHMGLPTSPLRVSSPMLSSPVPGRLTTVTTLLFHFLWLLVSLFNRTSIPWSQRSSLIFIYFILIFFYMFLVWTIFKVFIEFVTILLLFYLLVFLFFFLTTRQVKVPQYLPFRILHVTPFLNTATSPLSSFSCLIMLSTFSHPT